MPLRSNFEPATPAEYGECKPGRALLATAVMQKLQHLHINTLGIVWARNPANYENISQVLAAMETIGPDGRRRPLRRGQVARAGSAGAAAALRTAPAQSLRPSRALGAVPRPGTRRRARPPAAHAVGGETTGREVGGNSPLPQPRRARRVPFETSVVVLSVRSRW